MNDWRKPCEHGRYEMHEFEPEGLKVWPVGSFCPGGSPVTAADLEGLGEKLWVCDRPEDVIDCQAEAEDAAKPGAIWPFRVAMHNGCGWRLLIPIPDTQPATT